MGLQEIGFVLRLIFVYGFNLRRKNRAHEGPSEKETMKDFWTGLIFVIIIIVGGLISYLLK